MKESAQMTDKNRVPIEKPFITIPEAKDGTVPVMDSDGNSFSFCAFVIGDQERPVLFKLEEIQKDLEFFKKLFNKPRTN